MKVFYLILFSSLSFTFSYSQNKPCSFTNNLNLQALQPDKEFDNILNIPYCSDSLSSSFVIWVKKEVKSHRHAKHTENIYVIEGTATMKLGKEIFDIKAGDYVFIPKNTLHSVKTTSQKPLKVLSIQSPNFDGTDRILEE